MLKALSDFFFLHVIKYKRGEINQGKEQFNKKEPGLDDFENLQDLQNGKIFQKSEMAAESVTYRNS